MGEELVKCLLFGIARMHLRGVANASMEFASNVK
jgi:hypothetical protein